MSLFSTAFGSLLVLVFSVSNASALELDWHGQFRAETNWLFGYSSSGLLSTPAKTDIGYGVPNNGSNPAEYQNLFLELAPTAIVNDNVTIHSKIWVGTPDQGIFGGNPASQNYYYSTKTGESTISADELFAEIATDFGTIRVGRTPLNWGLGVIWNNSENAFGRFPSTGDSVSMVTKLGAFKFMPAVVKYQNGSNYGGTAGVDKSGNANTLSGSSGVSDYKSR